MKNIFTLFFFFCYVISCISQSENELPKLEKCYWSYKGPIIDKVVLMYEQSDQFTINIECQNINKANLMAYGEVYDATNHKIDEFKPVSTTLSLNQESFELTFDFKPINKKYTEPNIQSKFIKILIGAKPYFNGPPAFGSSCKYTLERDWMISESLGSEIVATTPVGSILPEFPVYQKQMIKHLIKSPTSSASGAASKVTDRYFPGLPRDILTIDVYNDKTDSSTFYYLPTSTSYSVWDANTRSYNIDIQSGQGLNKDKTYITAKVTPYIKRSDIELVKDRIQNQTFLKNLLPISIEDIQANLESIKSFGLVEGKDYTVLAPTEIEDPVKVTFVTTTVEDILTRLFANTGLNGILIFTDAISHKELPKISYDLKISSPATFGIMELDRSNWRQNKYDNPTGNYPIKLQSINYLLDLNETFKTVSYPMESNVPAKAKFRFEVPNIAATNDIDNRVKKIWLTYSIPPCSECNRKVKEKITAKLEKSTKKEEVYVDHFDAIEFTKAAKIRVKLRSYQLNPGGRSKDEVELIISSEKTRSIISTLYKPEGASLNYEYLIELTMLNGKVNCSPWIKGSDRSINIGSVQIKNWIPEFRK